MTGQKERGTTVEKQWKLDDPELKTPKHDELILMVTPSFLIEKIEPIKIILEDRNNWGQWNGIDNEILSVGSTSIDMYAYLIKKFGGDFFRINGNTNVERFQQSESFEQALKSAEVRQQFYGINDIKQKINWDKKRDELYSDLISKAVKWFIDERNKNITTRDELNNIFISIDKKSVIKITDEKPVYSNRTFISGYFDILVELTTLPLSVVLGEKTYTISLKTNHYRSEIAVLTQHRFLIEAKPNITSYGATIRQITTYKQGVIILDEKLKGENIYGNEIKVADCPIYILTPDTRFNERFESQGIIMISP